MLRKEIWEQDMAEVAEETCRICLETSSLSDAPSSMASDSPLLDEDRLISPCGCSGTQAFVHFKCLRKWQTAVMASRRPSANYGPALICSVCMQKFSVAPPRPALIYRIWKSLTGYSYEVAGLCIVLCVCYLALAGHNFQSLLEEVRNGLMLAGEVFPCSFRFTMLDDKCTSRTCSLLGSKWGSSGRLNLYPGTLLVATPAMPSPFFFGSVVLLYEHQRCSGSRGLILNMPPSEERMITDWEKKLAPALKNPRVLGHIAHGTGGPVAQHDWVMLKRCTCCASGPTNMPYMGPLAAYHHPDNNKKPNGLAAHRADNNNKIHGLADPDNNKLHVPTTDHPDHGQEWGGQELLPGIFLSRDVSPLLLHASMEEPAALPFSHQVLHGHAEWFVGQLWSEVKRGLWIAKHNASEVLLSTPPSELWHVLIRD